MSGQSRIILQMCHNRLRGLKAAIMYCNEKLTCLSCIADVCEVRSLKIANDQFATVMLNSLF